MLARKEEPPSVIIAIVRAIDNVFARQNKKSNIPVSNKILKSVYPVRQELFKIEYT